ncbi:MAG: 1-deoxy-D-xylulose-5-phosphate reductoisomerase [Chloroflexi bacterium]|nr:1-deoxy-D-xylulose-5-phosphate reductoisomerase [Chloroflexota bacterium]
MKRLAILGSTGSVGRQTLEVVQRHPDRCRVVGLAAGSNFDLIAQQVAEFQPTRVAFPRPVPGAERVSMEELASAPDVDLVVVATVGKAGLTATLAAIAAGKPIAMANKEIMVMAGSLVMAAARQHGVTVLPVDSALSAVAQCLAGEGQNVEQIILTCTGTPYSWRAPAALRAVSREELLRQTHGIMGRKLSIDSATLMREGMQVIEARWLFDVPFERISVVVHPENAVRALVRFVDGTVKAVISQPSTRLALQYALSYPERWGLPALPPLDLTALGPVSFEPLDEAKYPCFRLATEAGYRGDTYPAVLNAADEMAVLLFLDQQIGFQEIPRVVEAVLNRHQPVHHPTLEDILQADQWARDFTPQQVPE